MPLPMGVHDFTEEDLHFHSAPARPANHFDFSSDEDDNDVMGEDATNPDPRRPPPLVSKSGKKRKNKPIARKLYEDDIAQATVSEPPLRTTLSTVPGLADEDQCIQGVTTGAGDRGGERPNPKTLFATSVAPDQIAKMHLAGISLATEEDFAFAKPSQPRKIFVRPTEEDGIELTPINKLAKPEKSGLRGRSYSFAGVIPLPDDDTPGVGDNMGLGGSGVGKGGLPEFSFADVVQRDQDELFDTFVGEQLVGRFLESTLFRVTILFVILLNSITVGIQTDQEIEKRLSRVWQACDVVFLTIFVIEILLKWYNGFWAFWRVGWNVFDFFIVAVSILGSGASFVSSGRVLRVLKVLRAFRTLRSISALQGLQVIVQTVLQSLPDMGNILMLLGIITFIFAVVGISLFGAALPEYYGDLGKAMFTLFIGTTQDGWVNIVKEAENRGQFTGYAIYMPIFIVLGAFVFANLISGVVVTNVQNAYKESKANRKARNRRLHRQNGLVGDNRQVRPIADTKNVKPQVWAAQVPLELPDPAKFTVNKLENYFLILSALEDNLAEHQKLKGTLDTILNDIKELNDTYAESDVSSWSDEDSDRYAGNDALTRLLRRNQGNEDRVRRRRQRQDQKDQERREAALDAMEERRSKVLRAEQWIMGGLGSGAGGEEDEDWSGSNASPTPSTPDGGHASPVMEITPPNGTTGAGAFNNTTRAHPTVSTSTPVHRLSSGSSLHLSPHPTPTGGGGGMTYNRSFTSTSNLMAGVVVSDSDDETEALIEDKKRR